MLYDGDGRKTPKYKRRNKGKIPRLVSLPSTKWRPTVFRCPKTIWTYPKWERDPNQMGQKRQGWVRYSQLLADSMNFIRETPRSSEKAGWSKGLGTKTIGMGKIFETNK